MTNKVRDHRTSMGLTQQDLAAATGVSRQSIIAIEGGKYVPSTVLGLKIARALNASVDALFVLEEGD